MYMDPSLPESDPPFGLECGQECREALARKSGWYNQRGERIGWGDLTVQQMMRISREIGRKELFIVLPEVASFSRHQPLSYRRRFGTEFNEEAPGLGHIIAKATFIVDRYNIYMVDRYKPSDKNSSFLHKGIRVKLLPERHIREMLAAL
jgi:hypothetical protein